MASEYDGLKLKCEAPQYVPYGGSYTNDNYRGCTVVGNDGHGVIDGLTYLRQEYNYSAGHIWRGFGVLVGLWIAFTALTALGFEMLEARSPPSVLLYRRGAKSHNQDVEKAPNSPTNSSSSVLKSNSGKQSTFTWKNLDYFVHSGGEKKQLLDKVFGFVKPGDLVALMGSSGAGKTTSVSSRTIISFIDYTNKYIRLLDVLAQRKDYGEIDGSILIDGKPQSISFQRTTGYCEQMDVHEGTATVREALIFSAILRQPSSVPYEEKLAYVDHIIDLLELESISEALIGGTYFLNLYGDSRKILISFI